MFYFYVTGDPDLQHHRGLSVHQPGGRARCQGAEEGAARRDGEAPGTPRGAGDLQTG